MNNLFVVTRGGIGDHLISSGIVNHLSETNFVHLGCWKDWVPTLESLYSENPNVKIHPVQDYLLGPFHDRDMKNHAAKLDATYIGLATNSGDLKNYYRVPYIEQKLPFEYMYSKFKLPSKIDYDEAFLETMKPKNPYVLLNIWDKLGKRNLPNFQSEHVAQGLETVHITPGKTKNLLNWIPIILGAEEIHSVPGGPCHLIDLTCTGKLFYHDARMGTVYNFNNEFNNNKWHVIKYREKIIQ
jgi:hypothetical protein